MGKVKEWRLIDTGYRDGYSNMAIDESLLREFDPDTSLPIFRLYGWRPAAISLGRFQRADALKIEKCIQENVPVVRRMTGGGAIFHHEELTYSIVCSKNHLPDVVSVKDTYKKLCNFLILAYKKMGLDACYAIDNKKNNPRHIKQLGQPVDFCFAGHEEYDILIGGKKLGGNAQRWLRYNVFQHGSIPYRLDIPLSDSYLRAPTQNLEEDVLSLEKLRIKIDERELKNIFIESFKENLEVTLKLESLTEQESLTADILKDNKYSQDFWNLEGKERL